MGKKLLFVDSETSGLFDSSVILSLGMWLEESKDDPNQKYFEVMITPTIDQWASASPEALKVNGLTWEKLQSEGLSQEDAKAAIAAWLFTNDVTAETVQYVGQNAKFDLRFLDRLMGPELRWLDFPMEPADTMLMARALADKDRSIVFPNFKGWGIARALGIEEEGELHTVRGGVESVRRLYYALKARLDKSN